MIEANKKQVDHIVFPAPTHTRTHTHTHTYAACPRPLATFQASLPQLRSGARGEGDGWICPFKPPKRVPSKKAHPYYSPELAPLFAFCFFGVPLFSTNQAEPMFFCWGPNSSLVLLGCLSFDSRILPIKKPPNRWLP